MNNISISANNVTKTYRLYSRNSHRVLETFHPFRKQYHKPFVALNDVSFSVSRGASAAPLRPRPDSEGYFMKN